MKKQASGTSLALTAVLSPLTLAVKALYGMGEAINDFLDQHIADLKASDSPTIASTGRVLEAAKFGFGLGYMSSVAIMATGQLILGNGLSAAVTVASAATLTNPVAMTCAAIGAIVYGWDALTDKERQAILDRLSSGLDMGIELIKALIAFVLRITREFLSSRQLAELKEFIKLQAAQFGKSLFDITRTLGDLVKGAAEKAGDLAGQAVDMTSSAARKTADFAGGAATKVADSATDVAKVVSGRFRSGPSPAPLSMSAQALKRWEAIPGDVRLRLLRNVWCAHCKNEVIITDFTGRLLLGDLVLSGHCGTCQGKVSRLIEGG